jgi:CRISPR-associated endonuclease Cas2
VFEDRGGKKYARITREGQRALAIETEKSSVRAKRKGNWDKRYRMVIFDIPERKRRTRALLRETMREAGFLCIQRSVWIYPFDCEELIVLLKANLHIGKDVLYTIVEKIENDAWIRKHFGLPLL